MLTLLIFTTYELFTPDNYYILGVRAILNFTSDPTLAKLNFSRSTRENEFEGESSHVATIRLGNIPLAVKRPGFDDTSQRLVSGLTDL
ncbi:hypothetical protein Tco_1345409, partial [Tanacetum coccineum]